MNPTGGPAQAIYVVQPSEYRENGGIYQTEGSIAIPVYGYAATPTDRSVVGGPAIPVRVIGASDLIQNGGRFKLEGRPTAIPVYAVASGTRAIMGGPAIPIYAVNSVPPVPTPPVTGLFLDQFITAQTAPIPTPRTAEPGPGHWTMVQVDGQMSIAGGVLVFPTQGSAVWGDQGGYSVETFARVVGRAIMASYTRNSAATGSSFLSWFASAGVGFANIESRGMIFVGGGSPSITGINAAANAPSLPLNPFAAATVYQIAIVLRDAGVWMLAKGGALTNWTVILYTEESNSATLQAGFGNFNGSGTIDDFRVVDFPAPWTNPNGIQTNRLPVVVSGDTTTSTANSWVHVDWTAAAGETMELSFRRTDDSNRYIVRCIKNSNLIRLIKVEAGVETQLDSDAQTWTTGTTYRVYALFDGTSMSDFVRTSGTAWASRNASSAQTFNQAATGVKVAGATTLANLECTPRDVNALVPNL